MAGKRDQVFVGLFVLIAAAVLIGMVFAISGAFGRTSKTYHAYFPFAGGLERGATVRYAGGPKVGRVEKLTIDPQNPVRLDLVFSVQTDLPPVWLDRAAHRAVAEVNEEGTEAAAATIAVPRVMSVVRPKPPKSFVMIVDHPFLAVIRDESTKTILFMGWIGDPK